MASEKAGLEQLTAAPGDAEQYTDDNCTSASSILKFFDTVYAPYLTEHPITSPWQRSRMGGKQVPEGESYDVTADIEEAETRLSEAMQKLQDAEDMRSNDYHAKSRVHECKRALDELHLR